MSNDTPLFMPNDFEMMAARGAIASIVGSVALNREQPTMRVLDTIIQSVVLSLRWQPPKPDGDRAGQLVALSGYLTQMATMSDAQRIETDGPLKARTADSLIWEPNR